MSAEKTSIHFFERNGDTKREYHTSPTASSPLETVSLTHKNQKSSTGWVWLVDSFYRLFLPEGYPNTVSGDYIAYQRFDTFQALCSSVTGTLGARSILRGVGVGEATATALSGTIQWIIRDGVGMMGRIGFASIVASDLDNDAKRWRYVADITNDIAMLLDIFSTHLPSEWWLVCVCVAALIRSVTAVAGGATRASLTQHFAIRDNTADVAAKDGSQETAVNLIGMFVGMFVAWAVPETFGATLAVSLLFITLHLWSNYRGVTSLILHHLNECRANLCLKEFIATRAKGSDGQLPSPEAMRRLEPIVTHSEEFNPAVHVKLGVSLFSQLQRLKDKLPKDRFLTLSASIQSQLLHRGYAILLVSKNERSTAHVFFAPGVTPGTYFEAWTAAKVLTQQDGSPTESTADSNFTVLAPDATFDSLMRDWTTALLAKGWRLDRLQMGILDWRVGVNTNPAGVVAPSRTHDSNTTAEGALTNAPFVSPTPSKTNRSSSTKRRPKKD